METNEGTGPFGAVARWMRRARYRLSAIWGHLRGLFRSPWVGSRLVINGEETDVTVRRVKGSTVTLSGPIPSVSAGGDFLLLAEPLDDE